jgi:hypothetical protein
MRVFWAGGWSEGANMRGRGENRTWRFVLGMGAINDFERCSTEVVREGVC